MTDIDIYYASAGVGKTTQLLNILDMHLKAGVKPERIAFVTFTRKGAEVARLRTSERFGIPLGKLENFRTIHSMCFRALCKTKDGMMGDLQYAEFGRECGYSFGNLHLNYAEGIDWWETKDQRLIAAEQLYRNNKPYCERVLYDKVDWKDLVDYMRLYSQYKKTTGYTDFTDLLEQYIERDLFEDVDIVCLDEMQDSSLLQWQVVFKAFRNVQHMYVAGDDKQAIYQFAGASPDILINLKGTQHVLDVTYRVPEKILDYANGIAGLMKESHKAPCRSIKKGGEVSFIVSMDEIEIDPNKDYFFLARNNKFLADYKLWCERNGYPYYIKGVPCFTSTDKFEYKEGTVDQWDKKKLEFARRCDSRGLFYTDPFINISTIHGVKGDEADIVVLMPDMAKSAACQLDMDEDSEHRVFYVAVTRAKEKLYLLENKTRLFYPYLL